VIIPLGVAGLYGILWKLRENNIELPGDLWLVANVGEEGLGDLKGMRKIMKRFGNDVSAYIILEGMAYGVIFHSGIGVRRFRITFKTQGGHSWNHYGDLSAIHESAKFITILTEINLKTDPKTTMNIGVISGGTSINSIAHSTTFELDLRSESEDEVKKLANHVLSLGKNFAKERLIIEFESVGNRPAGEISVDHPLVKIAADSLKAQGKKPNYVNASTDANIPLSLGFPSICIGVGNGGNAHTPEEFIQLDSIEKGLNHVHDVILNAFDLSSN
jgi:tripeptide aminopeptidase